MALTGVTTTHTDPRERPIPAVSATRITWRTRRGLTAELYAARCPFGDDGHDHMHVAAGLRAASCGGGLYRLVVGGA